jgi:hypothetical protein
VKLLTPHDRYDVLLHGEHSSCECKGFLRHSGCKHVDGLAKLVERGILDGSPLPVKGGAA